MRDRDFINRLIDRAKAANCSALQLTLDLQILGQRHKDIKNGLSAPPKPTIANLINLATKPRWCLGMLGTAPQLRQHRGPCQRVGDLSSLSSWTAGAVRPAAQLGRCGVDQKALGRQVDPEGHHGRRRRAPQAVNNGADAPHREQPRRSPARWGASSIAALPHPKRWVRTSRCGWMAAFAAGKMPQSPCPGAQGTLIGRSFLYGLGAFGEAGVTRAPQIIRRSWTSPWLLRPYQHQQRGPPVLLPGTIPTL